MSKELYNYKRGAIKIAKELGYDDSVISRLRDSSTEVEICKIMHTAKENY